MKISFFKFFLSVSKIGIFWAHIPGVSQDNAMLVKKLQLFVYCNACEQFTLFGQPYRCNINDGKYFLSLLVVSNIRLKMNGSN
jgi:hypothetical protein